MGFATRSNHHRHYPESVELRVRVWRKACICFVDVRILDIIEDMKSSIFLSANFRATYNRYIILCKMLIIHQQMLLLPVKLRKGVSAANNSGVSHFADSSIHISSEQNILLIIQAADLLTKSDKKSAPFQENVFVDTPRPSSSRFSFTIWSKKRKFFRPIRCFLNQRFSKRKKYPIRLCLCSSVLRVLRLQCRGET